jgi:hypothetical protein
VFEIVETRVLDVTGGDHFALTDETGDVLALDTGARPAFHKAAAEGVVSVFEIVEHGGISDVEGGDHFVLRVETGDKLV